MASRPVQHAHAVAVLVLALAAAATSLGHHAQLAEWRSAHGCSEKPRSVAVPADTTLWQLQGEGMHRKLHYRLNVTSLVPAGCTPMQVTLAHTLPVELFTDPYELKGLSRSTSYVQFRTLGELDLESPASSGIVTTATWTVDVQAWLAWNASESKQGRDAHSALGHVLSVVMPVHARYPVPLQRSGPGEGEAWWSMLASGLAHVELPQPELLLQCSHPASLDPDTDLGVGSTARLDPNADGTVSSCLHLKWPAGIEGSDIPHGQHTVVWDIPAGAMWHADIVNIGTMVAAVVALGAVLGVLFRDRLKVAHHSHQE